MLESIRRKTAKTDRKKLVRLDILLAVLAVLMIFVYWLVPTKIDVTYRQLSGDKKLTVSTRASSLGALEKELVRKNVIKENENLVFPAGDTIIKSGLECTILTGENADCIIGGEKKDYIKYPGTIDENLSYNGISYSDTDVINPALDEEMASDTALRVYRVKYEAEDRTETVKPELNLVTLDSSLSSGAVRKIDGKAGKAVFTYTTKYVDGKKVSTDKKLKEWIEKKVDDEIRLGTSATGQKGKVKVVRTFTGNCTAYYFGNNAVGAAGTRCHYGTCAVDPSVIPYGTKLYIEGYGYAVANDCGSAVKGNVIDVYMRSTGEALQWGRRYRKVYVLG